MTGVGFLYELLNIMFSFGLVYTPCPGLENGTYWGIVVVVF